MPRDPRGRRYYALRYPPQRYTTYTILGRGVIVRTFATEAERDAWVDDAPTRVSVLYDGAREAVGPLTYVTERSSGTTIHISEAIPGLA